MLKATLDLKSRVRTNRKEIVLRPVIPTQAQAQSLALIYLRVVKVWQERTSAIVESYERTLAELVTDASNDTGQAVETVADQVRRLVLMLTPDLRQWAFSVERVHRGKWVRNIYSAVSVALDDILMAGDVHETIEAFMARNVSLIKDVSDQARGRIADAVFRGFQRRTPAREVAKEISEATGMARARAIRIASHQTSNFGEALNRERRRQAGIDHWKWRHSAKLHFRPEHKARDGKVYTDKTAPADLPGELPGCGCNSQAVLVFGD